MMTFHFLTIFPEMIEQYIGESMLKRASEKKLVRFVVRNIRDYTRDKHKKTDERPYGGGPGMVMTAEPILYAAQSLKLQKKPKTAYIMLSPSGTMFTNTIAKQFAKKYTDIVFLCGRYEGIDDRVRKILKATEYSIGEYTLTGGELPALVMTDAIARQIPGVLGAKDSIEETRIASPRVYTRPEVLVWPQGSTKGMVTKKAAGKTPGKAVAKGTGKQQGVGKKYVVPKVLVQGDHKKIDAWRQTQRKD